MRILKNAPRERLPRGKGGTLMSPRVVAKEAAVGLPRILSEIKRGKLVAGRIGEKIFVSRPAYERWLNNFGAK